MLFICPKTGHTQPVASSVDPPPRPGDKPVTRPEPVPEPTAADVAGAPVPGQESGRLDRIEKGDSAPRLLARGFLFLPKIVLQVAFVPVRAGIYANERYRLFDRAQGVLFTEDRTIGVYPTIGHSSGFGITLGARFVHRDLFGARERLSLSARTGGRYQQQYMASLRSGDRLGEHLGLELRGEYDRRPKERFYGIGNRDEIDAMTLREPLDALADPFAVETRYRQDLARATAVAEVRFLRELRLIGSGALTDIEVGRSEKDLPIDVVYLPETLVGWEGARHVYGELELRWDNRRSASSWEPRPLHSGGWFAGVYGGRVHRLDGGADFWRYGGHVQHFVRIGRGPRVIAARAHVESVSGSTDEVPFFELPSLGGSRLLRGYPTERFRDRIAALGSLDYEWDLSQLFTARLFADAGRVYSSADDLTLSDLRVGYGIGIDMHTKTSFILRTSLASSIDGGVFLNLAFDPVFEIDDRVERR